MDPPLILDEEFCKRLPLPLAQLYRRAHTAKSELEQQRVAYLLWEATLKLMATVVVMENANRSHQSDAQSALLQKLAQPQSSDWCEMLRELLPLAAAVDASLHRMHALLTSAIDPELPRCAELAALFAQTYQEDSAAKPADTILDLFDQLAEYRDSVFSMNLPASRPQAFYGQMGRALLAGIGEWLPRIDVLAAQQLVFVSDVTARGTGRWLVQRYSLTGDIARRISPLEISGSTSGLPQSGSVYLDAAIPDHNLSETSSLASLRSLHPLLVFDVGLEQVFFLGCSREGDAVEYLCYTTGQTLDPKPLESDLQAFIARLVAKPVDIPAVTNRDQPNRPKSPPELVRPSHDRGEHTIGEFDLLTRMGQGGMGVVFRAWQPSLGRQVAVKSLLRTGDPKAQARFSREIHALARVEHPHLVKIFSSGVQGDHWYYAMELIDGVDLGTITERLQSQNIDAANVGYGKWFEELQRAVREARLRETAVNEQFDVSQLLGHEPSSDPAAGFQGSRHYVRHIVELMLQVAQATQSLHDAGVIHRDIKPGNVMLTADGNNAVLMDLGLAQIADDEQGKVTRTRQFIGTLRYASPEQVLSAAAVDQRSDIYSLGATLWELLTLHPLFGIHDESTTLKLMQRIEYTDPESIRKYNPAVPKDLDAIVGKCLEKSPDRRYASVAELVDELTRFLEDKPVQARPLGKIARAGRSIRRHPMATGLAVTCITTVLAILFLAINVWRLQTERGHTIELRQANQRADQSFRQAVEALDDIFNLVTEGDLRKRPDLQPLRDQLLTYYQNYVQQFDNLQQLDNPMTIELARIRCRIAKITNDVGNKQDALRHYDSAIESYQRLLTRTPTSPELVDQLSQTWIDRGTLRGEMRDYEKAESDFIQARDALSKLSANDPQNFGFQRHLAEAYHSLGILYEDENRFPQSLSAYEQGRQIREQLVAKSDDREFKRDLGRSYGYLGDVQIAIGEYQQALRSYRRSVEIRQQVADSKPTDHEARFQLARGFRNLGYLSRLENDLGEAIKWYTKATAEDRRLVEEQPLINDYRSDLARYGNDLAELLIAQGTVNQEPECFAQAEQILNEALLVNKELIRLNPNDMAAVSALASTYVNLTRLAIQDDASAAREYLKLGRQQFERLNNRSADDLYEQAVWEVLSATLPGLETATITDEQARQREFHIGKALSLLSQSVIKSRFTVLPRFGRDTIFEALRKRPEFQSVSSIGFQGFDGADQLAVRGDRRLTQTTRAAFRHLYVLAVGVSEYKDATHSLQFPDADAQELAQLFNQQHIFDTVAVTTLINAQADRISILNALKQLRLKAIHPSLFLVVLSGHGKLHEGGDYYFLPYDFDFDPDAAIAATGISWDDLLREFKEVPGSVIVMVDTCHSGAATNIGLRGPASNALQDSIRQAAAKISESDTKGIAILASSLSAQAAQERPAWGHGALSLAIIEALGNQRIYQQKVKSPLPVPGTNQMLSMEQVRAYAVERVNELTDGQQKVIVQSNMSLIDVPFNVAHLPPSDAATE